MRQYLTKEARNRYKYLCQIQNEGADLSPSEEDEYQTLKRLERLEIEGMFDVPESEKCPNKGRYIR